MTDQPETFHACPPDGSGLTPCCGRTPFELPPGDRISSETVTCRGPAPTTLRDRYAAAIASYDHAVGQATNPAPGGHHHGQADAVLAVRDQELERRVTATEHAAGKQAAAQDAVIARHREQRKAAEQLAREACGRLDAVEARARDEQDRADKAAATVERVRAECDRIEAAVRANPQAPDFDGAYLAAIGHIRRALDPTERICRRCHCPAGTPDCQHCNCCDVPDQPPTALRDQYAAAIDADLEQFFRDHPEEPRNSPWVYGMRDAAAAVRAADAVRDHELEQLRAERDLWRQRAEKRAARYEEVEAAEQRVRAELDDLCREPHPSHDHVCPDDVRRHILRALDQPPTA